MGLFKELPERNDEFDVVIAGGGTAGCVVAARLSDADPDLSILLVERGPNNDMPTIEHPAAFLSNLAPDSKTVHFNVSRPSADVGDRPLIVPSGSVLGGGSSVNFMMYSRAQRCDLDAWETPGWSANELLPYMKKSESYHGEDEKDVHGLKGPMQVSRGTYGSPAMEAEYIAVAEKMGYPEVQNLSGLESVNAVWRAHRFISPDGKRQDAATCFVHPRLRDGKHPNLHVLLETQVDRVLFDDKNEKATGIVCRGNPLFAADAASKPLRTIKARKLVILSCGACATPAVLERSGVGESSVLERAGIPVVADLPGVGNDYEDHHLLGYGYKSSLDAHETADAMLFGRMGSMEDLMKNKHKILGWNAQEVQGKMRPSEAEVDALGPEFRKAWDAEFKEYPEKPMVVLALIAGYPADPVNATGDPSIGVTVFSLHPFSRGKIHITGPSLDDPIDFDTGFFSGEGGAVDVKKHVWAYKKQRELVRRMPSYRGEVAAGHPPFAPDSPAACVETTGPLPTDLKDIVYSADDDAVLERWLRGNVGTTWHSLGTCKMRPREKRGVVDSQLGVYGLQGLKIADLSIAPGNVAANTNHTALMVGEKAADIFIGELGLGPA